VPHSRPTRIRAGIAVVALVLLAGGFGLGRGRNPVVRAAAAATTALELPDTLTFDVRYDGLGAEGVDLVWRGTVRGAVPARVTIRMEYAGRRAERGHSVWPVNAWLFYAAEDPRASFAAELSGSMDWRAGEMRVTGLVSDGARLGLPLEQRLRVRQPALDGSARVVFLSTVALTGPVP
jgi:hypothetical protein